MRENTSFGSRQKIIAIGFIFLSHVFVKDVSAYQHETLSAWTIDCFKNLEEPEMGKFKTQLTAHDLKEAIRNFIDYYKTDINGFLDKLKWVNPSTAPVASSDSFDLKCKKEYVYPYVQKLAVSQTYPDINLLQKLKMKTFLAEKKRFKTKFVVIGDIHGSLHSLLRSLWRLVVKGYLDDDFEISRPNLYMIFTGDYVDRGGYSPDVIYTLLRLKLKNPEKVFLLRGNHEDMTFNKNDPKYLPSIWLELNRKYSHQIDKLEPLICRFYDLLPHALYVVCADAVVKFCHGGIEPLYNSEKLINDSGKVYEKLDPVATPNKMISKLELNQLLSTLHKSKFGPMLASTDFMHVGFNWCDFSPSLKKTQNIKVIESRGYQASMGLMNYFLKISGINAIFRGHQHYAFGLKMYRTIEGSAQNGDHWSDLVAESEKKNDDGFTIKNKNFFPVFTFSTAAASSAIGEKINLPFDCFAVVTAGGEWGQWRLKPYEFEHNKRTMFNLDKNYVSIDMNKKRLVNDDLLIIRYWKKPFIQPVDAKLLRMAEVNTSNKLIADVQLLQTLNPAIKASDIYNSLIRHLHKLAGWD